MEQQGQQMPRTITLKELGLTGEAWVPHSVSAVVFLFVAITGVLVTTPAWYILGVGKPFLPEFLMPVTAFVLMLITTGGADRRLVDSGDRPPCDLGGLGEEGDVPCSQAVQRAQPVDCLVPRWDVHSHVRCPSA